MARAGPGQELPPGSSGPQLPLPLRVCDECSHRFGSRQDAPLHVAGCRGSPDPLQRGLRNVPSWPRLSWLWLGRHVAGAEKWGS